MCFLFFFLLCMLSDMLFAVYLVRVYWVSVFSLVLWFAVAVPGA